MSVEAPQSYVGLLSNLVGTTEPALRLLLSVFAAYPLALLHRKYLYGKDLNIQHLYFTLGGISLGYFNYGFEICHSLCAVILTYILLAVIGGTAASCGISFVFNMGYLLIGYYYAGTDDYDINWTMPQCVLVLRLIGLTFDLYDGKQPEETLGADNKKVMLKTLPSFLEFCGHMFFPASFMVGPQFPMKRYQQFVQGEFSPKENPTHPPDSTAYGLRRFLQGVFYLITFQVIGIFVNDNLMISDFSEYGFIKRMFILGVWGRYSLYKYISCWLLTEGACITFGLTHNGENENGEVQWNGCENVKLSILENTTQFGQYIVSFNINTNHWLGQYIYKRLKFLGNRLISQAVSLLFLAVWHGFHTGYYICFAFEFMVMYMERDFKPILKSNEKLYGLLQQPPINLIVNIVLRLYTFVFMGWCLLPFALLTFERYWVAFGNVYFIGFLFFTPWPVLYSPIVRMLIGRKRKTDKTK